MGAFDAIDIGRTGIGFSRYWLDTISHNIANVDTVTATDQEPFRARFVVAAPNSDQIAPSGSGVHVADVLEDGSDPNRVYAPDHPLADADGYVNQANVDLAGQLTDMMIANRTYQANVRTIQTAREAYETALRLGQRG